ncbi:MAG: hypothetical protein R2939_04670 [Kofleriaceae bacterium]
MKTRALGVLLLVACGGSSAAPGKRQRVGNAALPPFPDSPWSAVFVLDARFDLMATDALGTAHVLHAEVDQLRAVGDARVARLVWEAGAQGAALAPVTLAAGAQPGPHQIVESPRGLALMSATATDDEIAAALRSPTTWMFPTPSRERPELDGPEGQSARLGWRDGEPVYCYAVEQPAPCAPCGGEVCVAAERGLVSIGGAFAPDGLLYERAPGE